MATVCQAGTSQKILIGILTKLNRRLPRIAGFCGIHLIYHLLPLKGTYLHENPAFSFTRVFCLAASGSSVGGREGESVVIRVDGGRRRCASPDYLCGESQLRDETLWAHFEQKGAIVSAQIARNDRGRSKGFGFVEYTTKNAAERGCLDLNETVFDGRPIQVNISNPRTRERAPRRDYEWGSPHRGHRDGDADRDYPGDRGRPAGKSRY
jgi:hypothetical protein